MVSIEKWRRLLLCAVAISAAIWPSIAQVDDLLTNEDRHQFGTLENDETDEPTIATTTSSTQPNQQQPLTQAEETPNDDNRIVEDPQDPTGNAGPEQQQQQQKLVDEDSRDDVENISEKFDSPAEQQQQQQQQQDETAEEHNEQERSTTHSQMDTRKMKPPILNIASLGVEDGDEPVGMMMEGVEESEEDERTLLDVFGEVSKEYLTQRVIPDTDADCHWDWRSLRCEPACECLFDGRWGDYHLGRSCRKHNLYSSDEQDGGSNSPTCIPVDPSVVLREAPIPKRVISLVSQTLDIFTSEIQRTVLRLRGKLIATWQHLQERLCHDTWALSERVVAQHRHQNNATCIPASMALTLHTTRSFWERALCGPPQDFPICE